MHNSDAWRWGAAADVFMALHYVHAIFSLEYCTNISELPFSTLHFTWFIVEKQTAILWKFHGWLGNTKEYDFFSGSLLDVIRNTFQ